MTALYNTQSIRELESQLTASQSLTLTQLMQRAGAAAWRVLQRQWPDCKTLVVYCGQGNNGGDGFVLAQRAHEAGLFVTVYALTMPDAMQGIAADAAFACQSAGVTILPIAMDSGHKADVIVDALLGIGCDRPLETPLSDLVSQINQSGSPVLAIDVPTGVNADTGCVVSKAVNASVTVTFVGLKLGLFTASGPAHVGHLLLETLSDETPLQVKPDAQLLSRDDLMAALPRRRRDTHKGDFGHVLIIGGDHGMGGAVRMAAEAAMRVGAGLVTVASRPEHLHIVTGSRPELMCRSVATADDLMPLIERATVVVIGPGLGQSEWSIELMQVVQSLKLPLVLDADALNLLAQKPHHNDHWIITPHPGEAASLLLTSSSQIQNNRFLAAQSLQQQFGGVAVLKGAGTIVQSPSSMPMVCAAGNPGMSSGGMGDVLSGVLGGLLAQDLPLSQAAEVGVLVHALAADRAVGDHGERGLLAPDVLNHLRWVVNPNED